DIFNLMTSAMTDVAADADRSNRRHEIKSMLKLNYISPSTPVIEKSGYIGLDYEGAPGLMESLGIQELPETSENRIVVFFANTFAKVKLNNGYSVIISYQISKPV